MKKEFLLTIVAGALATATASAQPTNGGTQESPQGSETLVSIDAHNVMIAPQTRDKENPDQRRLARIAPRHIYSGALTRILGGQVVSTQEFLVPGSAAAGAPGNGNARNGVSVTRVGNGSGNNLLPNNSLPNNSLPNNFFGGNGYRR